MWATGYESLKLSGAYVYLVDVSYARCGGLDFRACSGGSGYWANVKNV